MSFKEFQYLSQKIKDAEFSFEPYKHLLIENFFNDEHFKLLTTHPKISLPPQMSTEDLIDTCLENGYLTKTFPGALSDSKEYLKCLESDEWPVDTKRVRRAGLVLFLKTTQDPKLNALVEYFKSEEFVSAVRFRFPSLSLNCNPSAYIQKYLTGYEISPHPDKRAKCMTWLVNINTDDRATNLQGNTKLLKLRKDKQFIKQFWQDNPNCERDWLPWDWCDTVKTVNQNNSLVMFEPDNDTIHGIKLDYDHLSYQRTQLYGNIDLIDAPRLPMVLYTEFDVRQLDPKDTSGYLIVDSRLPGTTSSH